MRMLYNKHIEKSVDDIASSSGRVDKESGGSKRDRSKKKSVS